MASPRVFVSSTYYDLKYIRENLKYFINNLGYEAILSEDGDVFYNPSEHTHDSCLGEIPSCQLFVLIIGGRYGGKYKKEENSITNKEYKEALKCKIPIFALIEASVYSEHNVYNSNKDNQKINYPSVDNIKIFDFIDEVRREVINNAIVTFNNYDDIESYLKKQWAGLMYSFLTSKNNNEKVVDTLSEIKQMNKTIEMISKSILSTVDKKDVSKIKEKEIKIIIENSSFYETLLRLYKKGYLPEMVTVEDIEKSDSLESLLKKIDGYKETSPSKDIMCFNDRYIHMPFIQDQYNILKDKLKKIEEEAL